MRAPRRAQGPLQGRGARGSGMRCACVRQRYACSQKGSGSSPGAGVPRIWNEMCVCVTEVCVRQLPEGLRVLSRGGGTSDLE